MGRRRDYWGYYYSPSPPKPVKDGIKTKSKRGTIGETWWSKRWISVLESFDMGARLTRGRSYARQGQVISIDVKRGVVTSAVQGTRRTPYAVEIRLKPLSDGDWDKVAEAMAARAIFAAKLLSGEMPTNIEEAFHEVKISLFPASKSELKTECSCPDWANPCKHIAAVYYLLAERFDQDPFLIFKLRGRTKDEIIEVLREKRATKLSAEDSPSSGNADSTLAEQILPLEECVETFWQAGEALDSFAVHLAAPEVSSAVLKRLGDAPFTVRGHDLTVLLSRAYDVVTEAALEKASGDECDV